MTNEQLAMLLDLQDEVLLKAIGEVDDALVNLREQLSQIEAGPGNYQGGDDAEPIEVQWARGAKARLAEVTDALADGKTFVGERIPGSPEILNPVRRARRTLLESASMLMLRANS